MDAVANAIADSELNHIVTTLAPLGGNVGDVISLAEDAAISLAKIIAPILKSRGDDVLDFYEGNYPVSEPWELMTERHRGTGTSIELRHVS